MRFECRRDARPAGYGLGRACGDAVRFALWSSITVLSVLVLAAGLLVARLDQGPVTVPGLGLLAEQMFNSGTEDARVSIGSVELTLGEAGSPAGLEFRDVEVRSPEGTRLLAAPQLAARFHMSDLASGRLQPVRLVLIRPEARIIRAADGRIRVGLGTGFAGGMGLGGGAEDGPDSERAGMDVVARIIRGFVGDEAPVPELQRLREVAVIGATLTYEDALTGRRWVTRGSNLRIVQTSEGAQARFRAALTDDRNSATGLTVEAERLRGTGRTDFLLRLQDLRLSDLAGQVPGMDWARGADAPLSGLVALGLGEGGRLDRFEGRLSALPGTLRLPDLDPKQLQALRLAFAWDPALQQLDITEAVVASDLVEAEISGRIALDRDAGGLPAGVSGELTLGRLAVDLPGVMAGPVAFDGGRLGLRWRLAERELVLSRGLMRRGTLVMGIEGRARFGDDAGPVVDLRATAEGLSIADLKALWPLTAAANARDWVAANLLSGNIDRMVAQIRIAPGTERMGIDFTFSELTSTYLGGMSPITGAAGRAHVSLHELFLTMTAGRVTPVEDAPISLAGSRLAITDFEGKLTPADIDIRASGPVRAVLALIDQKPLGLISKLGLDPGSATGDAVVAARLGFPLLDDLLLEQVNADVTAELSEVSLPIRRGGRELPLRSDRLLLRADTRAMTLDGRVRVDGVPLKVSWRERYGDGKDMRDMRLDGALTPALLARLGVTEPVLTGGTLPAVLRLSQQGSPALDFAVTGDLGPAALALPLFDWSKPAGSPGRIEATGRFDNGLTVESMELSAGSLSGRGGFALTPEGGLRSARIRGLKLGRIADLDLDLAPSGDGLDMRIGGRLLDVSRFVETPQQNRVAQAEGMPLQISFALDRVVVSPKIALTGTSGGFSRAAGGAVTVTLDGRAGGAPFRADYARTPDQPGSLRVTSPEAGGLLRGLGFFVGGQGGRLTIEARTAPDADTDIAGTARIADMRVRDARTFETILKEGGVDQAVEAAESGGLLFDEIDLPFSYADGILTLEDAIATSPMLAVKVAGTVNEAQNTLSLSGVISPAYAVTGVLDNVPLLGAILSGGKGEGILAMTFSVGGSLEDPDFSVNPLSLLAPGFLRKMFTGRAGKPSGSFIERIERDN